MNATEMKNKIIELGGKEWNNHGKDRVYMSCDILNILREERDLMAVCFSERNNKIFFDVAENAVMRSYKGKKPTVEIQY